MTAQPGQRECRPPIQNHPTDKILEVKNLECGYETFKIRDISFEVRQGGFLGIIGPNGSGKTSLLKALSRILKPVEGTVQLEGKNIWGTGRKELAQKVAVVSQSSSVSHIMVEDFVLLGRIPHHGRFQFLDSAKDVEIAVNAMEMTGAIRFRHKMLGELSGGERQLVLIARALTQQPKVILLDEPTNFLDITHQVQVMDLIRRMNRECGLTVITVLHDLNLAGEYCKELLLMNLGRIFKMGTPDEVLTYTNIEEVYRTMVVVGKSPVSSRPYIFVVTEEEDEKRKKIQY
jgi:iron complex transport system ATP-binding protein